MPIWILREINRFAGGGFPLFPVPRELPVVGPLLVRSSELKIEPRHRLFPVVGAVIAWHLQQAEFAGRLGIFAKEFVDLVGTVERLFIPPVVRDFVVQPAHQKKRTRRDCGQQQVAIDRQAIFTACEIAHSRMEPIGKHQRGRLDAFGLVELAGQAERENAADARTAGDHRGDPFIERRANGHRLAVARVPSDSDALGIHLRQREQIVDHGRCGPATARQRRRDRTPDKATQV